MVCRDPKKKSPPKEVYVVDADGRNLTQLTHDNTLSLSPAWAPDGKSIAYTQFDWRRIGKIREKGTVIKRHNLLTGERKVLVSKPRNNSGAAWAPDGSKVAATLSFTGRPEIYLLSSDGTGEPEPLSRAIQWKRINGEGYTSGDPNSLLDVEPNFAPNGTKLVLSSARSGHPMIYVVDLVTKAASQLTFAGIYNASPAWSPKGDKIIFAAQRLAEGNFDLYLIDPDGNNLARITVGEKITGRRAPSSVNPSWAPTGRHIVFSSNEEGGREAIYRMTLDGSVKKKISPPEKECSNPAWGPGEG